LRSLIEVHFHLHNIQKRVLRTCHHGGVGLVLAVATEIQQVRVVVTHVPRLIVKHDGLVHNKGVQTQNRVTATQLQVLINVLLIGPEEHQVATFKSKRPASFRTMSSEVDGAMPVPVLVLVPAVAVPPDASTPAGSSPSPSLVESPETTIHTQGRTPPMVWTAESRLPKGFLCIAPAQRR
jgi:hypothetical protein